MNPKKISLFLLLISIVFPFYQIFAQVDTLVVIQEDQSICWGFQPDLLTIDTINPPNPDKYQWQNSTDILPWANIDTATREVYQPPALEETTRYRLIVTYHGGTRATDTSNVVTVTVFDEFDTGSITATVIGPICYGDDGGTLTANPAGGSGDYTIKWISSGDTIHTGPTYDVGMLHETTSFYYYVKDNEGCGAGNSDTITIVVYDELIAGDITGGNTPICSGSDGGTLRSHPSGGSGSNTIKWYKNNGVFVPEGQSLDVGALTATTDFYYAIEDEECGTVESASITIEVMDLVQVGITITVTPGNEICEGETAHFKAAPVNGGSDPSYQWKLNNINVGNDSDEFESSTLQTGDKITCQLTSSIECAENNPVESSEILMTVNQPGEASIDIEADNTVVCPDDVVTFTSLIENGGDAPVYDWLVNNVPQGSNSPDFVLNSLQEGSYVVQASLKSDAPCIDTARVYSEEIEITVNPAPVINDLWVKHTPEIGRPVVLIVCCLDSETEYTYTWYKDDHEIEGAHGQYYYKPGGIDDGTYYVEVGNASNCTTVSEEYTYPEHKELFVNNTDMFAVYPNPSSGRFGIELNNDDVPVGVASVAVSVYKVTGEKVFSGSIVNSTSEIDLTNLSPGVYFLEIRIAKGQRQVKKLLISK